MKHPIVITPKGKLVNANDLNYRFSRVMGDLPLRPTKFIIDQQTWDDILKWQQDPD